MKSRRLTIAATCVMLFAVLLLMACPADSNTLRQAAVAAKDASSTVVVFQDAEIASFQSGVVDAEDHKAIQGMLLQVSDIGHAVNAGLRSAHDNQGAVAVLSVAVAQIDQLEKSGALHIKNKDLQMKWSLTMVGVRTTLASISAMMQPAH